MQLSQHFTLEELIDTSFRQYDNIPDSTEINNLKKLALKLEEVRSLFNKPIIITSGFRCKEVNDAVGSKDTSDHRKGLAADFKIHGLTPDFIVKTLITSGIKYKQLIKEFNSWVHIAIPSDENYKCQTLIIDKQGTRIYS